MARHMRGEPHATVTNVGTRALVVHLCAYRKNEGNFKVLAQGHWLRAFALEQRVGISIEIPKAESKGVC